MKKFGLILPFILVLSGCGSDLDLVKNGVMNFNKTTTLGKVLDNWKSCEKRDWKEFETDSGIRVVEFSCEHKIALFLSKLEGLLPEEYKNKKDRIDIKSNVQTFQFTINKDKTFQLDNVQNKTTWSDGTYYEEEADDPVKLLEAAYKNQINFDPNGLDEGSAFQVYVALSTLKTLLN